MVLGVELWAVMGDVSCMIREDSFFLLSISLKDQRHCSGAFGVEGCVTCADNDELLLFHDGS